MADKKAKERQLAEETIEAAGTAGETAAETAAEASEDVIQITQADLDNFTANCPPALRRHRPKRPKKRRAPTI